MRTDSLAKRIRALKANLFQMEGLAYDILAGRDALQMELVKTVDEWTALKDELERHCETCLFWQTRVAELEAMLARREPEEREEC